MEDRDDVPETGTLRIDVEQEHRAGIGHTPIVGVGTDQRTRARPVECGGKVAAAGLRVSQGQQKYAEVRRIGIQVVQVSTACAGTGRDIRRISHQGHTSRRGQDRAELFAGGVGGRVQQLQQTHAAVGVEEMGRARIGSRPVVTRSADQQIAADHGTGRAERVLRVRCRIAVRLHQLAELRIDQVGFAHPAPTTVVPRGLR